MPKRDLPGVGWREWVSLPQLEIDHIKAKVDTGARTSALHAFSVKPYRERGTLCVRFAVHPLQKRREPVADCFAEVSDFRWVSDSGGHREKRFVIVTPVILGGLEWPIEMTLTDRDTMQFRMLLGRTALKGRFVVHPGSSYLIGKPPEPT
ncbi:ATP-dependent zinc protease family protein [Thiohalomonas denitrificans]|uniref:ATP-dependent zinc protease family protein n=1 Tax=Thiohalomonas denitrificans TaxID=415747 RepID=UPI0026EB3587|nr:RimK/LysX family protein [Thiohalomonas denitrificans]